MNCIHKLMDESTGLFWSGHYCSHAPIFNEKGVVYKHAPTAQGEFRKYEINRLLKPELNLPALVLVSYQVQLLELSREACIATEQDMIVSRFELHHGKKSKLSGFIRHLCHEKVLCDYTYIIKLKSGKTPPSSLRPLTAPRIVYDSSTYEVDLKQRVVDLNQQISEMRISSKKTDGQYLAVRSDAEVLYAIMALGDKFSCVFSVETGLQIDSVPSS